HAAVSHYGYSTDEFLQMTIADIRPTEDVPALMEDVGKGRSVLQHSGPWRHVTKDGSVREVDVKSHTLDFEGRSAALVVVDDVTERNYAERQRQKLERQLRQVQKMEAVGQLAGGIAHDFNNILSVIINYAALMKEDFPPEDPRFEDLEEIRTAGERGATLVRQILAFSRKEIVNREVLCLNRVVADMEKLLRRTIGEDLDLDLKLGDGLWPVVFDSGHVEQILINLAVNARDAMRHGGKLAIATSNAALDVAVAENHPEMTPGEYVCLTVSDSGAGMTEEVRARIFEPFFTTKPVGEGTGLGLAMVYGIVKQAEGYVYAYSEPGVGSTFRIYLPAVRDAEVGEARVPVAATPNVGTETVLLVEDEPAVRELARRILSRAGYHVVPAEGGAEAVQAHQDVGRPIDLLLTDVIMPGMSGKELNRRLREESGNGLKTLYMSGYTDEIVAERGLLHPEEELIQKPFTADGLLTKVREVLDGGKGW
ncbi:MAG: ATP-binding protein, partial [Actinomycetota bacterium]